MKKPKTKKQNRWLALALCLCLLASVFPLSGMTYAAAQGCNHVHDKDCGYIAAAGAPCTFRHTPHDDTCGYAEAKDASPCSVEAAHIHDATCGGDPDTGEGCTFAHVHDDTCGYAEAKDASPCSVEAAHSHDDTCGYVKAVAGAPCTHVHDADCGGLAQDSGPVPCTKTEGCKLPAGHEGDCDADNNFSLLGNTDTVLEVTYDQNSIIGTSPYDMLTAVNKTLTETGKDKTAITTIRLTGVAAAITGENWRYLLELYQSGSDWTNLSVLDLSGMTGLDKIEYLNGGNYSEISNLTEVRFPASLKTIGKAAFFLCKGLTSVRFPDGLETIGASAFAQCTELEFAPFPASLQTVEGGAFSECSNLKSADLSGCQSLEAIGNSAFSGCSSLPAVSFPDGLKTIGNSAFADCSSLPAVSFPASLQTIGESAFSGCSSLNALTFLGNTPPNTGTNAFLHVAAVGVIDCPAASSGFTDEWKNNTLGADWTLTATGGIASAFSVHPDNQSKNAGESAVFSVTATGAPAPSYQWQESTDGGTTWKNITDGGIYSGFTTDTLTLTVVRATHNGYQYRCVVSNMVQAGVESNAATLTVTGSVIAAVDLTNHDTFWSAVGAASIPEVTAVTSLTVTGQTKGGMWTTTDRDALKAQFTSLTDLDLSGYTGGFGESAFDGCTQLAKVTMPTGSYEVSKFMFYKCTALEKIDVSGAASFGDWAFFGCTSLNDVTMPTGSYAVPEYMFQGCTALKEINMSGATSFGYRAFEGCTSLNDVTMPTGSYAVSEKVFYNCTELKDINVSGATSFGKEAFYGCAQLAGVTMPTGSYAVPDYMFQGCTALEEINVSGATSFGERAFDGCTSLTKVTMPTGNYAVSERTFFNCTELKDINVSGATSFGKETFEGCTKLADVTMPTGSYAVPEYMFFKCESLKSIDVSGATSFGERAFYGCTQLAGVTMPTGSYAVSDRMFYGCKALKEINVSGATSFGYEAFWNCGLKTVWLPGDLEIPDKMFNECGALETLAFLSGAAPSSIGEYAFYGVPTSGTVYYPTGQSGYKAAFAGTGVRYWNFIATDYIDPIITTPPTDQNKKAGETAVFSVTATGDPAPDYQWQVSADRGTSWTDIKDDGIYSGATTRELTFMVVQTSHSGYQYRCVVSNILLPAGLKSGAATLTVTAVPILTAIPGSLAFGDVTAGTTSGPKTVTVGGADLSSSISYEVTGADAGAFRVSENSWDDASGGTLNVIFTPTTAGANYSATLTISSPGAAPVDVSLTGSGKASGGGGGDDPAPSTYSLTVRADTGGKITQGASGYYEARKTIFIEAKADAGYKFTGWTSSNGGDFANSGSVSTTFTMPGNATIVTANFRYTGGGSDPDPGPSYTWRALTDPSGVRVSGLFTSDAALEVKEMLLHLQDDCDVCDNIRQRQKNGELIVLFDIALKSGKYKGDLDVEIPVGGQYNGQSIVIIHCKDKVMDSRTVTVENGMAKGTFSKLSPYAAAKVPGKTVITGLPESYTLLVGQSVSWTPSPAGGAWSYDTDLLEMTRQGDTYTFKALKEGKAAATYTVDGVPFTVTIAVNSSTIPQTGDTSNPWPWALLATAALLGCAALVLVRRGGYKKRHG